jgi:hypothetical protein
MQIIFIGEVRNPIGGCFYIKGGWGFENMWSFIWIREYIDSTESHSYLGGSGYGGV